MQRIELWDLPTRVFHWLLAVSVGGALVTGYVGGNWIEWHARLGELIVGLVVFRVVWGFVGAPSARFAHFVRGPSAIAAYVRGQWQGVGHNPLGALSVLALLALSLAQAATGLFATDDIAFQGPWAALVGDDGAHRAASLHGLLQKLLIGVVLVHLAAIVFYALVKRRNLVRPMLTGWQAAEPQTAVPAGPVRSLRARAVAFTAAVSIAALGVYLAAGGRGAAPVKLAEPVVTTNAPAW